MKKLNRHTTTAFIFTIVLASIVCGIFFVYRTVVLPAVSDSLHTRLHSNVKRAKQYITSYYALFYTDCKNMATSADMINLIADTKRPAIHSVSLPATVDTAAVFDAEDNPITVLNRESSAHTLAAIPVRFISDIRTNDAKKHCGLLKDETGILFVAGYPVYSANYSEPQGSLVIARYADSAFFDGLNDAVDGRVQLKPVDASSDIIADGSLTDALPAGAQVTVSREDSDRMYGITTVADIHGAPSLRIEVSQQKTLIHAARLACMLIIGIVLTAVLMLYALTTGAADRIITRIKISLKKLQRSNTSAHMPRYAIRNVQEIDLTEVSRRNNADESKDVQQKERFIKLQNNILFDLARMKHFSQESFDRLINTITESTASFLNVDRVCIWLMNEDCTAINLFDLYNHRLNIHRNGEIAEASKIPAFFEALNSGDFISVADVSKDPRLREFFELYLSPEGISSVLDVPITFGDTVRGVLCHEHIGPPREWTMHEERYASSIGDLISLMFDKFEHKKMEEEFEKTKRIEFIGVVAGGIAHDFNNLLTAILGNCTLAQMSCTDDEQNEFLRNIECATNRARDLSRQLLNFAKEGMPVKETASIVEIIRESAGFSLKGSNVQYTINADDDLWNVRIDKGKISQVINNIIINADHAMPHGGTVTITCSNTTLSAVAVPPLTGGKYVKIDIEDEGIGISKEDCEKIFDPYFTTKEHGSGLGLATCFSIIKKHHGSIQVSSQPGKGTEFSIYLPAVERQTADLPHQAQPQETFTGQGTILIMDDDEMVRNVMGQTIASFGYDVIYATDGEEALAIIKQTLENGTSIDAVIMDLTIPGGMGGRETIEPLRELAPSVKAFVSSGYSNDPVMCDYEKYGFSGIVSKPIDITALSATLHCALSKKTNADN